MLHMQELAVVRAQLHSQGSARCDSCADTRAELREAAKELREAENAKNNLRLQLQVGEWGDNR